MSNALAIAAVTATLRNLLAAALKGDLGSDEVTVKPPDKVRSATGNEKKGVNLFLYHISPNAAYRNMDLPGKVKPGESANPPLALNLYYLVTVFGEDTDEPATHKFLGKAMGVLHDHPVLGRDEIKNALEESDLHQQIERVRITPQTLTIEEISKLWTIFQTQYRISAAYQVSVVLIDSTIPVKAALPVLTRGENDKGVDSCTSAAPVLTGVLPPFSWQAVRLGEDADLIGSHVDPNTTAVRFENAVQDIKIDLPIEKDVSTGKMKVHLPNIDEDEDAIARWAPGIYHVSCVTRLRGKAAVVSNKMSVALAPKITVAPTKWETGDLRLTIASTPRIRQDQTVFLIVNDRQILPTELNNPDDKRKETILTFVIPNPKKGTYVIRLRVDGVDSIPVIQTEKSPVPVFDPEQQVIVS